MVINVKYLKIGTPKLNSGYFFSVLNYGVANSVGPDETAPLIWVRTICSELFITSNNNVSMNSLEGTFV